MKVELSSTLMNMNLVQLTFVNRRTRSLQYLQLRKSLFANLKIKRPRFHPGTINIKSKQSRNFSLQFLVRFFCETVKNYFFWTQLANSFEICSFLFRPSFTRAQLDSTLMRNIDSNSRIYGGYDKLSYERLIS